MICCLHLFNHCKFNRLLFILSLQNPADSGEADGAVPTEELFSYETPESEEKHQVNDEASHQREESSNSDLFHQRYSDMSNTEVHAELMKIDKASAEYFHPNDRRKVIR